jgi:endonuclease-8
VPEGDTIHRSARTLQEALGGKTITRFETVLPKLARVDDDHPIRGRRIERVTAVGKHLIIELSGDLFLETHMRMSGSWHIYRTGERWQRPRGDMRIVIATSDWVAVGFNIPVAEFRRDFPVVGPDILGETLDIEKVRARIREYPSREIADVLLNQQVVAGIGNIYKSESLFLSRVSPFAKVEAIDDATLDTIVTNARKIMRLSVESDRAAQWWVYGRANQPCRKCGTTIEMRKQGPDARVTFWCPKCQLQ